MPDPSTVTSVPGASASAAVKGKVTGGVENLWKSILEEVVKRDDNQ